MNDLLSGHEPAPSLSELVACAKRELAMRRNVYRRWIMSGKMKPDKAGHEIRCMEEIVKRLEEMSE